MDPLHQSRHSKTKTRQASKYHMHRLSVFLNDGERFPFFLFKINTMGEVRNILHVGPV